jgi:hypothetical protein
MHKLHKVALATLLLTLGSPVQSQSFSGSDYTAAELLSPCQESDNDARWGEAAETECEQYILGFVDALAGTGAMAAESGICPPAVNTADEVRWAYMRWVHADYSARRVMRASEALLATLKSAFPCS